MNLNASVIPEPMLTNTLTEAAEWLSAVHSFKWSEVRILDAVARSYARNSEGQDGFTCLEATLPPNTLVGVYRQNETSEPVLEYLELAREIQLTLRAVLDLIGTGTTKISKVQECAPDLPWMATVETGGESIVLTQEMVRIRGSQLKKLADAVASKSSMSPVRLVVFPNYVEDCDSTRLAAIETTLLIMARKSGWGPHEFRLVVNGAVANLANWDGNCIATLRAGADEFRRAQAKAAVKPEPLLTTREIDAAFGHLVEINLGKALTDDAMWAKDARRARGAPGGRSKSLWDPYILAVALRDRFPAVRRKLSKAFETNPMLAPWLQKWQEDDADFGATSARERLDA